MDGVPYQISTTDRVVSEERDMEAELAELKAKIEENELVYGIQRPRNVSSIPLPKDISFFRRERELVLKRGLEVCEARPVTVQAEVMEEEAASCLKSDYTPDALPLLLHQFFLDRIHTLVQCKHQHMLRWTRFLEHTSSLEALYPHYQDKLKQIMLEYNDCLQRAQRLSSARECHLNRDGATAALNVRRDDLLIYLRWLVSHLHSTKRFNQYMRVLQWIPITHEADIAPKTSKEGDESEEGMASARIPSKYQDDSAFLTQPSSGLSMNSPTRSRSNMEVTAGSRPPTAPSLNHTVLSTNPLPASQMSLALAAAGGGLASDEASQCLPLHCTELDSYRPQLAHLAHLYGIELDVDSMSSSAEEMELYATVNRKFRQVFSRQETMRTFKTCDRVEIGQETWGADHSSRAVLQECLWLAYRDVHPQRDAALERKMTELRARRGGDELLRVQSRFMQVTDNDKVQDALREHAVSVRDPPVVSTLSITSPDRDSPTRRNKSSPQIANLWKSIYANPQLYAKEEDAVDAALHDLEDKEAADRGQRSARPATGRKRRDSYNYMDTVQLLGLDEGEQDSNDPASIQGAFISYLQLRHLRIRDLRRTCLGILNYFRSIERTLTINDGGLSLDAGRLRKTSPQNHQKGVIDGSKGAGSGLGSHHYVHYTPKDFKLSETEFMEFSEIENHDDFYSYEEGRVHVQDQRGYYVMYEAAIDDLTNLENDLLLIASHYIEKDKDLRAARSNTARTRQQQTPGHFDVSSYSHQEVDRFGVLLDMWTHEASYLECKKELLDCYLEAYQHVSDRDERRLLTQELTDIMYRRPRYDFSAAYCVRAYRLECVCLRLQADLVKRVLDTQIEEQRDYLEKLYQKHSFEFGLPHQIVAKQPISVNMSRSALKNVYMLEFHPSLAVASKIPEALKHAYQELYHNHRPSTVTESLLMDKRLLETAIREWTRMDGVGASMSVNVRKDVFGEDYVEQPVFLSQLTSDLAERLDKELSRKSHKERQKGLLDTCGRVLQMVTARHRLMDATWETEILSKVYKKQSKEMGYDEFHLFLRFVQFEYATVKEKIINSPIFITAIQEDDSMVDRVTPKTLFLAIHELDESSVGRISFATKEQVMTVLKDGGVENLEVMLLAQVVHKNALVSAVQQAHATYANSELSGRSARPSSPSDTQSQKSSATATTAMSASTAATSVMATKLSQGTAKAKKPPEAFLSIQLEKNPIRDQMLNEFAQKKQTMETILRNPLEMARLKRKLINDYSEKLQSEISQYSIRGQIIAYYNSILSILEDFPIIRDNYFMYGEMNEKKSIEDTVHGLESDSKSLKKRPRRMLTDDGQHLLNLWFIPHYSEVLVMYKRLDSAARRRALVCHLRIVAAIHDILQYLCAHARLGSSTARRGQRAGSVTADWGGTEGIGTELVDIQRQVSHLPSPTDPDEVSRFLVTRRDVMFLEFDAAVRHSMRDTFLSTNNKHAYQTITDCMHHALHFLSDAQRPAFSSVYLGVPEPLAALDDTAQEMYPYRALVCRRGLYPVHFWPWRQIEYNMCLCLAGLKEVDKHMANGEILGLSLLMEDVLTSGQPDRALYASSDEDDGGDDDDDAQTASPGVEETRSATSMAKVAVPPPRNTESVLSVAPSTKSAVSLMAAKKSLSRTQQPLASFELLHNFLCLWKRLEMYKRHWGRDRLGVQQIGTPALYKAYCKEYRKELLYPILQSVARRSGQGDLYEGLVSDEEPLVMPRGASEMEIRSRQLAKLLETQEVHMIREVRKKLNRELNLVLAERQREEDALPTDLWKKPSMKETVTINRPHIAEDFIDALMSGQDHADTDPDSDQSTVVLQRDHLNSCLTTLANDVMVRERHNYENYSMYYENVLRTHHQLLYQREQEIKQLQDQLKTANDNNHVTVQCQLAETSHDLILEVIALRAKIEEMREDSMNQERIVRDRVKAEYDQLVQDMFGSSFDTIHKFDKYRVDVVADIKKMIDNVKETTITEMDARKEKAFSDDSERPASAAVLEQVDKVRAADHDNHMMNVLLMKTRAMNTWRQVNDHRKHTTELSDKSRAAERSRKESKRLRELHAAELVLMREQVEALRAALLVSENECDNIRRELEREASPSMKVKKDKQHAAQQKANSQKQLNDARRANIDKLLDDLEDKDTQLRSLSDEKEKTLRVQQVSQDKTRREVGKMKKQLSHERNMKLDAFNRVDELQTQVYDMESVTLSRPQTAIGTMSTKSKSRATSAATTRRPPSRNTATSSAVWPPAVTWPANRSLTPAADLYAGCGKESANADAKKIQRPKTAHPRYRGATDAPLAKNRPNSAKTMGRLRSRIADQLLYELDPPDHHETLIKLGQAERLNNKVC